MLSALNLKVIVVYGGSVKQPPEMRKPQKTVGKVGRSYLGRPTVGTQTMRN